MKAYGAAGARGARVVSVIAVGLALLAGLAGCARGVPTVVASGDYDASLVSGGLTRTYHVHLPPLSTPGQKVPLVLALHGRLGDGAGMTKLTGFNPLADQYGFIVVYPDGYQRSWADGRGTSPADQAGVDDIAFLGAVLDAVEAKEPVDATRVYVTGMSNGGFMTERLGCDLAQRFAAIAIVAANFEQNLAARCAPAHNMPALLIHGSDDPLVPESGGDLEGATLLSTAATVARWAALAGCAPTPMTTALPQVVNDGTSVTRLTYSSCQAGAQVIFYDVTGAGHVWPGGPQYLPVSIIGKTSANLNASLTIWQFFTGYHL